MAAEATYCRKETPRQVALQQSLFRPRQEETAPLPADAFDSWGMTSGAQDIVVRDVNRRTAKRYRRMSSFRRHAEESFLDVSP